MRRITVALAGLAALLLMTASSATAEPGSAARFVAHTPPLVHVSDGLSRAVAAGRISPAKAALLRAEALFHPRAAALRAGTTIAPADGRDATPIMQDLSHRAWELTGADRAAADSLLARPSEGGNDPLGDGWTTAESANSPDCDANVCVHWTDSGIDAPPPTDANTNNIPDWVEQTLSILGTASTTEVGTMGYRPPKSDMTSADHGPDARLDVYRADIGGQGIFGYVNSDDPHNDPGSGYAGLDESTYMVLDDDMSAAQFGLPPLDSLQVTIAHEFFHTIQGAYDWYEDHWLMEGTATWIEDVVYDDVNQSRDYLGNSLLTHPTTSLDSSAGLFWYGSWLWFEFLTEWAGTPQAPDRALIQDIWNRADARPGAPDQYSVQAIRNTILALPGHHPLSWAFGDFAMWNRDKALYQEGASFPPAPQAQQFGLGPTHRSTGWLVAKLNHLSYIPAALVPGNRQPRLGHVTIRFDAPPTSIGSAARVIVRFTNGTVVLHRVALNSQGNGSLRVAFGHGMTSSVLVILVNGSGRYTNCFPQHPTNWSCAGTPVDQMKPEYFNATLS
jgi:hypothetical protein